jgi:hypothetical protein
MGDRQHCFNHESQSLRVERNFLNGTVETEIETEPSESTHVSDDLRFELGHDAELRRAAADGELNGAALGIVGGGPLADARELSAAAVEQLHDVAVLAGHAELRVAALQLPHHRVVVLLLRVHARPEQLHDHALRRLLCLLVALLLRRQLLHAATFARARRLLLLLGLLLVHVRVDDVQLVALRKRGLNL